MPRPLRGSTHTLKQGHHNHVAAGPVWLLVGAVSQAQAGLFALNFLCRWVARKQVCVLQDLRVRACAGHVIFAATDNTASTHPFLARLSNDTDARNTGLVRDFSSKSKTLPPVLGECIKHEGGTQPPPPSGSCPAHQLILLARYRG